ncbi:Aldedh-domain-containing protein [Pleurotus eryngii]|uniref:Aldedh-domain-containing protein n=1 Tax=Pleurotus eryngii TaxID=5323 RepID=A0A9P5ZG92_PLEER|nr:Aldedh-domain-containing protein [Pleurotus eryngii]
MSADHVSLLMTGGGLMLVLRLVLTRRGAQGNSPKSRTDIPIFCWNTIVFKSSELSPRSQVIVADLFAEAGLPPEVLNIISISTDTALQLTAEIIAHPMVRKVALTGSERVGRILAMEGPQILEALRPRAWGQGTRRPADRPSTPRRM